MITLNCLGDFCPVPMIKLKAALKKLDAGEQILLVTDHSCVVESISTHFKHTNIVCNIDEVLNGVWEITVHKKS